MDRRGSDRSEERTAPGLDVGLRSRTSVAVGRAGRPVPSARAGAVPAWVPLALLFVGLFVGLNALQRDARSRGLARIDATRYRLHTANRWLSDAWTDELERVLVDARELTADDRSGILAFVDRVEALSFVAEVGVHEFNWPDGLTVPVRLHEPVACVQIGGRDFLPVAPDGTILAGYAYAPHAAYGGFLPALGPLDLLDREQGPVEPGDRVTVPALLAALDVANTMWDHLAVDDLRELGRVVIDATAEDAPVFDRRSGSVTPRRLPGGVVIELERGRRVVFGRPPKPVHAGELPVAFKWGHVREALAASRDGDPWALVDARFDEAVRLTPDEVREFARSGEIGGGDGADDR